MLDKLSQETIEAGREHPFVQALLREFKERLVGLRDTLVVSAGVGNAGERYLYQTGGRAFQLDEVIRVIQSAKGAQEDD